MEDTSKKARTPKSEKAPAERRLRDGMIGEIKKRLAYPDHLKHPDYVYYWAVDSGSKINEMYARDWDIVSKEGESVGTDVGNAVSVYSGKDENNGAQRQYLMRKHKDFYESDKDAAQRLLDEQMNQLKNPLKGTGQGIAGAEHRGSAYVPSEGINIK